MTLKKFRSSRHTQGSFSPERMQLRSLLRKAARGNAHSYVQAISSYSNLISEYLYLAGYSNRNDRIFELKQILTDCWRYLPYTRRVSDFERFLQVRLERVGTRNSATFCGPHALLASLSHEGRFLLVARIMNGWSIKSLRLAMRAGKKSVAESLMLLRCKLTELDYEALSYVEQAQILRVSELLEGGFSEKAGRKIETSIRKQYHAHQFKADWLSYRCELADLQTDMSLTADEAKELSESVTAIIKLQPMEKPRLYDSLVNQFRFVRHPSL